MLIGCLCALSLGCGQDADGPDETGGTPATGGASGMGGTDQPGGTMAPGGASGTGGAADVGGSMAMGGDAGQGGMGAGGEDDPGTPTTEEVFQGLSPACAACHGPNTQDPYFGSLADFVRLMVENPDYIRGGDPEGSELVHLLEGTSEGTFTQMPPFDASFAALEAAGETDITIGEIERWISRLEPFVVEEIDCGQPRPARAPLRRLTSTEYTFAVQDLLGIDIDPSASFPGEEEALGFDNNADALNVTRLLAEKYFEAGELAAETALASPIDLLEHVGLPCRNARLDCVRDLAQTLAYQAYRRPLAPGELDRLLMLFDVGQQELGDFMEGVKLVIAGILQSPHFLYRLEFGADAIEGSDAVRLTDFEMAARLSFFLWASMPDAALFEAAEAGALRTRAQVEAQAGWCGGASWAAFFRSRLHGARGRSKTTHSALVARRMGRGDSPANYETVRTRQSVKSLKMSQIAP